MAEEQHGPRFLFLSIDNVKNAAFTDGSSRLTQPIYSVMDPLSLDWMVYSSHSSPGRAWLYDIWTPTKEYHPGQKIPIVLHSKHPLAMDFDNGNGPTIEVYTKMADGKENSRQTLTPLESAATIGLPQRGDSASCGYYATYLYEVQEYDVGTLQVVKDSISFDSVNTCNYERRLDKINYLAPPPETEGKAASKDREKYLTYLEAHNRWGEGNHVTDAMLEELKEALAALDVPVVTSHHTTAIWSPAPLR
ncbi:hypothetical protein D1841_17275 [Neglecta sp. X4]|uniref:hypothetical protein n=1 Tax=unclassified Neglectibacter TaxID=2632164 RepID=UPI00136828CC|nr:MULTISPECIES: hypothetical protein [unclassified Neglectibacter]NBI19215.1 hypothetical protein [Neglectibacter sp. 59]NBJ74892.1 hypothetical protein [Neglectibacter sp. X4]NCE82686.1 hypothetical protein [Neglectibacter sp. X58]